MNSGIYKITNKVNNRIYIGSAKNLTKRFYRHTTDLNTGVHYNQKLLRAWEKYGKDNFLFEVIEYVDLDQLITREQYHLDTLLFASEDSKRFNELGYNILRNAYSTFGRKHSEETKRKIGDKHKGKIISEEHKLALSKANSVPKPHMSKKFTDEHIKNLSESHKGQVSSQRKEVIQLTKDDIFIREWSSITEAERELKISNIFYACSGRYKHAGGFKWKYKTKINNGSTKEK